jgi:AraC family transcriptional regulator, transcriptional activator FtrA
MTKKRHLIAMAVTAGAPIFELSIPCEIFGRRRAGLPDLGYDLRICVPTGPAVHTGGGFVADTPDGYDLLERADTVIISALGDAREEPPADLVAAVNAAHRNGARIVSLCSGAFVLAAAASWTAARLPRTGCTRMRWRAATRRSSWTPQCSTWTTVTC